MDKMQWPDDVEALTLEQAREAVRTLRIQLDTVFDANDYFAEDMRRAGRLDGRHDPIMRRWIKSNARTREGYVKSYVALKET